MDIFTRIERIKAASKNQPLIEQKIKHIESRYAHNVFSSEFTMTMDPEVIEELDEIERSINSTDSKHISFLKDSLIKQVQSLVRLPLPQPPNFNRDAFNSFVSIESRDIKNCILESDYISYLLNIMKLLENQRLDFLGEPHKTIFTTHLHHFQGILNNMSSYKYLGEGDKEVLETLVKRIRNLDIQVEELEFFMEKYSPPIDCQDDKLTFQERDIEILQMIDDPSLFHKVSEIMGISKQDSDLIFELLFLEKQKTLILSKLSKKLDYEYKR
jgi:hypothetical protein